MWLPIDILNFYCYADDMQRRTRITILLAISAILIGTAGFGLVYAQRDIVSDVVTTRQVVTTPPTSSDLLILVNIERAKVGATPLVIDTDIQTVAQMKADDMSTRNYFEHNLPGTDKLLSLEMAVAHKGKCIATSENLHWAKTNNTSQGAVDGWVNSRPHYAAMINADYLYTGFGIAGNKVVEHFCVTK